MKWNHSLGAAFWDFGYRFVQSADKYRAKECRLMLALFRTRQDRREAASWIGGGIKSGRSSGGV